MSEGKRTVLRIVSVLCFMAVAASMGYGRGKLSEARQCAKEQTSFGEWCKGEIGKCRRLQADLAKTSKEMGSECMKTAGWATECAIYLSKSMTAEERCWDEAERCQAARR